MSDVNTSQVDNQVVSNQPKTGKFRSRTFWITVVWLSFVPLSIITQMMTTVEIPIKDIIGYSGALSITYVGGNKLLNTFKKQQ